MAMHNKSKTRMKKLVVLILSTRPKKNIRVKRALCLTCVVHLVLTCTVEASHVQPWP